jgi:hypothetical protein
MNCRDTREVADSFLCEELLTETNHEILRHLDTCPSCRTEIEARRRLRAALRAAFDRAPDLQPSAEFRNLLREQLRDVSVHSGRAWSRTRRWLALAAGVVFAVGVAGLVYMKQSSVRAEALAQDAIGDHQNCALKFRLVRMPVPLEQAAEQFDSAYRVLLTAPPAEIVTPDGPARVTERHSCAYGARRFGHIIMEYRGRVVSLLMTANDEDNIAQDAIPHVIGRPIDGLSVMSVDGAHHSILLVGDLEGTELAQLSKVISVPLARQLQVSLRPPRGSFASLQREPRFELLPFNPMEWRDSEAASVQVAPRGGRQSWR